MTLAQIKKLIIGILKGWFINKKVLDKISEDDSGNLNYNGKSIANEIIYTDEEIMIAISEILNNLNDIPEDSTEPDVNPEEPEEPELETLSQVTNILATIDETKVNLTWDAVLNAEGYEIYSCITENENINYVPIGTTENTEFEITELICDTKYKYAIKAYKTKKDGSKIYSELYSELKTIITTHTRVKINEIPSTYTKEGTNEYYMCMICNDNKKYSDINCETQIEDSELIIAKKEIPQVQNIMYNVENKNFTWTNPQIDEGYNVEYILYKNNDGIYENVLNENIELISGIYTYAIETKVTEINTEEGQEAMTANSEKLEYTFTIESEDSEEPTEPEPEEPTEPEPEEPTE